MDFKILTSEEDPLDSINIYLHLDDFIKYNSETESDVNEGSDVTAVTEVKGADYSSKGSCNKYLF